MSKIIRFINKHGYLIGAIAFLSICLSYIWVGNPAAAMGFFLAAGLSFNLWVVTW